MVSRKALKKGNIFNPRAANDWSKDDSKFGQRMLEKMGWKKGEGLGLHNQGIADNIKVRLKVDSKGLGFKIKEDQWVEVEHGFSELLTQLNKDIPSELITRKEQKSLESVSHSSRSRVHYKKWTRAKDLSKYNVRDLVGILGQNEITSELLNSSHSEKKKRKKNIKDERTVARFNEEQNLDDSMLAESREKLLNKYRMNFRLKYLESANENDSSIYTELTGDKLDVTNDDISDPKMDVKNDSIPGLKVDKLLNRPYREWSKAERIIMKAKLLKRIQNEDVKLDFKGSNLCTVSGYGNLEINE